jgi:hypothetical protein
MSIYSLYYCCFLPSLDMSFSKEGKKHKPTDIFSPVSEFFRPEPPVWISRPLPGSTKGGPLDHAEDADAYITESTKGDKHEGEEEANKVTPNTALESSPVKTYMSKARGLGEAGKTERETIDKALKKKRKFTNMPLYGTSILTQITASRLHLRRRSTTSLKAPESSIKGLSISGPILIDPNELASIPPLPPLPANAPTRPARPPPILTSQVSNHPRPSISTARTSHSASSTYTKTNNATPRVSKGSNTSNPRTASGSTPSSPPHSPGPHALTISSIPTTPLPAPATGYVTPSPNLPKDLSALRYSGSIVSSAYSNQSGSACNSAFDRTSSTTYNGSVRLPRFSETAEATAIVVPKGEGKEFKFVQRSLGAGARGQVMGTMWRDPAGFLHWVGDI